MAYGFHRKHSVRKLLRREHPPSAGSAQAAGRSGSRVSHERLVHQNQEEATAGLGTEQQKQTESTLSSQPLSQEPSTEAIAEASCAPIFAKWGVNTSSAGFHTCYASFILPWDRIERYPKGFYREALQHALDTSMMMLGLQEYAGSSLCGAGSRSQA